MKKSKLKINIQNNYVVLTILLLIGFLVYGNVIRGDFINLDDQEVYVNNPILPSISESLKTKNFNLFALSIMYQFFGLSSAGFHAFSIFIHVINSFILFLIAKQIINVKGSFLAAILFLVHPGNSEAVSWLSGNVYLTTTLLSFLTIYFFNLHIIKESYYYLIGGTLIYTFAVLFAGSPWILVVPPIIFTLDYFVFNKNKTLNLRYFIKYLPIVLLAIFLIYSKLFGYLEFRLEDTSNYYIGTNTPPKFIAIGRNLQRSFSLLLFPLNLSIVFNYYTGSLPEILSVIGTYALLAFLFYKLYFWDKKAFGLFLCIYLGILPLMSPIDISVNMAERYYYVAIAFFSLLVGYLYEKHKDKFQNKDVPIILASFVLVLFSFRTFIRTFDWLSNEKIWMAAQAINKNNYQVYFEMGNIHYQKDELKEALEDYNEALKIRPIYPDLYYNAGLVYVKAGRLDDAINAFSTVLRQDPNHPQARKALEVLMK